MASKNSSADRPPPTETATGEQSAFFVEPLALRRFEDDVRLLNVGMSQMMAAMQRNGLTGPWAPGMEALAEAHQLCLGGLVLKVWGQMA